MGQVQTAVLGTWTQNAAYTHSSLNYDLAIFYFDDKLIFLELLIKKLHDLTVEIITKTM